MFGFENGSDTEAISNVLGFFLLYPLHKEWLLKYEVSCLKKDSTACDCGRCHIGETGRPLEANIKEHKHNLRQGLLEKSKLAQMHKKEANIREEVRK
jgi:hypothetical protein